MQLHEVPTASRLDDSWSAALPALVSLYTEGNENDRDFAAAELRRMASFADRYQDAVSIVLVPVQ